MTVGVILLGTLVAGVGSVWIAALLSFGCHGAIHRHMLSLAAGALLATAFMHLSARGIRERLMRSACSSCCWSDWCSFFLLDKAELWHHGHEHHYINAHDGGVDHRRRWARQSCRCMATHAPTADRQLGRAGGRLRCIVLATAY